jgi:putative hydrolase of the HAD superfamily
MFAQSNPCPQMMALVRKLKAKYGLKIAAVSNEALELNDYRIRKFKMGEFVDFFISSCYVHVSKPDADIMIARSALRSCPAITTA